MRIQHNIMAMNAYRNYGNNTSALSKNLEKLSSGYRINRAGDDAAGLAISEKMRAQIQGLNAAQKNVKDAISFVKTAEGAMQEIQDMLSRMKYLATQSANGTYEDDVDRAALQDEVDSLLEEINRIAQSANFNDIHMLNGGGDDDSDDGTDKQSADFAVGYALAPDASSKKDNQDVTITSDLKSKYAGDWGAESTLTEASSSASNVSGGSVEIVYEGHTIKVTLSNSDSSSTTFEEDNLTLKVQDTDKLSDILKGIEGMLASRMSAITNAKANEDKEFTAWSGIKLTSDGSGDITATVTKQDYKAGGSSGPDKSDGADDTKKAAVPKGTKTTIDFSSAGIKDGDYMKVNGKWYVFKASSAGGDNSGGGTGGGTEAGQSVSPHAGTGDGSSKENAVEITLGADDKANATAIANILNGITGISATATDGKITITADDDFDTKKDFTDVFNISFEDKDGKAISKLNDAITKALNDLTGGGGGAGTGTFSIDMQIGDSSNGYDTMTIKIKAMSTDSLGISDVSVATLSDAHDAIDTIKDAINEVSKVRGQLGAYQNRLEHTANNLSVMTENIQDAESTIRDTDVAEEMMAYTKNNILIQSAQAMLAQANAVPQGVLQLLG